jgi:hypothetical protein
MPRTQMLEAKEEFRTHLCGNFIHNSLKNQNPLAVSYSLTNRRTKGVTLTDIELEDLNSLYQQRRTLAFKYANMSQKGSIEAKNLVRAICALNAAIKQRGGNKRIQSIKRPSSKDCPRCQGYGMGQYHHIERGRCFHCGTTP